MTRRTAQSLPGLSMRAEAPHAMVRALPEETPVALVFNGTTQAVMMATPADLEPFGLGFALSEGIVEAAAEVESLEVLHHDTGIEVRMWIPETRAAALAARRRSMLGPVGCGLCGIDSLEAALRAVPQMQAEALRLTSRDVDRAAAALMHSQPLHDQTRAVHAAGFWADGALRHAAEDVGRHNALDKLVGLMAGAGTRARDGALVLTSRVSVDMVQKAAMAGAPIVIAASAPTAHAVRVAEAAGITLACLARGQGFDLFSHPDRIVTGDPTDVA